MINIIADKLKKYIYYADKDFYLLLGDSTKLLRTFPDNSIDMIFADPPYFLSNDGISCQSGKMVSVNKGGWDKSKGIKEKHKFNVRWLKECKRILKKDATIWVSGTSHIIYSIGFAMQELEFKVLNDIIWYKKNAPPNLSCRYFTHSTETIIWAAKNHKSKHFFNYQLMKEMNGSKQKRNLWNLEDEPKSLWQITAPLKNEKIFGKHPTQKPEKLLEVITLASTKEGDIVLDPFNGSGTTSVVSKKFKRRYVGIDFNKSYLDLTIKRILEKSN